MAEPFKVRFDPACAECRALDETCPKHKPIEVEVGNLLLGFEVTHDGTPAAEEGSRPAFPETPIYAGHDWLKPLTVEMTFKGVDPELLGILTGGVMSTQPPPSFALEMWHPVKRTFWQWLRRKPRQFERYYIPAARLAQTGEADD